MSFKEFINEKKKEESNHKESTEEAVTILQAAIAWLKGSGERVSTENKDAKEIIAKAISNIGTLDIDNPVVPEEDEKETKKEDETEVVANEEPTTDAE